MDKVIPLIIVILFLAVLGIILVQCQPEGLVGPSEGVPQSGRDTAQPGQTTPAAVTATRGPLWPSPTLSPTPTATRTPAPTPTPTFTPTPEPRIEVSLLSCDTGIDLRSRLGEVTNAYILVQNVGERGVMGTVVTLEASDEEQPHPDKSYNIGYLPSGYEIAIKLTVDTQNGVDTTLTVTLTTVEGVNETASSSACSRRTADREVIQELGELEVLREIE